MAKVESNGDDRAKLTIIPSPYTQQYLTNIDTGDGSVGLAPGASHPSLQSIGTGARQHFVYADDMVWMCADAEMETFFASDFDKVSNEKSYVNPKCS